MNALKIGNKVFSEEQLVTSLVQYKLLEPLVSNVILDSFLQKISLTQEEVLQFLNNSPNLPEPFESLEEFLQQWCQDRGTTLLYVKVVLLRELQIKKLKRTVFGQRVEAEFLRRKQELDQVEFRRIVVPSHQLAGELFFQLRDDAVDFATLAKQHSQVFDRHNGGLVGPVRFSTLPLEIAKLFRSGYLGQLHPPVHVQGQSWIVRLERIALARLDEAARLELIDTLFDEWLQAQVKHLMSSPGGIQVQNTISTSEGSTSSQEPVGVAA